MNCREVREVMFLYTDNEMADEVRVIFSAHLVECPGCARRIERAVRLISIVRERCVRASAPERLRRRILTSLPHRQV